MGGTTAGPGNAVVNVYINQEKKFAFVEFRTGTLGPGVRGHKEANGCMPASD